MASAFISTPERTNFARMCWIVVDVFRDILWHVLTDEISPADLPNKVQTNQHKLSSLNKNIKSWLCSRSSPSPIVPNSRDFDVTSLYTLIRNLCKLVPTNGWAKPLPSAAGNIADVVEWVRVFRNAFFGHAKEGQVSTTNYSNLCSDIKTYVTSFDLLVGGNSDFVGQIDSILTCSMDKALQDTYIDKMQEIARLSDDVADVKKIVCSISKQLEDREYKAAVETSERRTTEGSLKGDIDTLKSRLDSVEKEYIDVTKQFDSLSKEKNNVIDKMEQDRIIDLSQKMLKQHRYHAEKHFVETQAFRNADEILRQHRRLIITGKSGQGKSYMALQLLNKIITDDTNIKPLIISTVEQWKTLVDSSISFCIIVDDMCGVYCLNEGDLIKWTKESRYMPTLIDSGKHVVIFTMKSFFYEKILVAMQSCPLFSSEIILNLDTIKLNATEKSEFTTIYLKEFRLDDGEVSKLCNIHEATVGFPQLCRATEKIKNKSTLLELFSKPQQMILEQIKHLRKNDSMTYGCLVSVLLSREKLNLQLIRDIGDAIDKKENIIISVFRSCGISEIKPIQVIDTIKSLQGTYLSLDSGEESYLFDHDSIEDAVFIDYGEFFPEKTLLYGPLQLVCKRCTIKRDSKALETTTQDSILTLQPSYQTTLINRLVTELKGGNPTNFAIVSEATFWSCKDFRKAFVAKCKEIILLADKDENSLMVHAAIACNCDLVVELLQEFDHIPETQKRKATHFLTQSAIASCAHKDTYLLEKICEIGRTDVNHILPNSIRHGSVEAVQFLLQIGAHINYRSKKGENLIHIACLHARFDIVKFLHSKNTNLVNEFDNNNRRVTHCCAAGGSVEILEFILPLGIDPISTDLTGWNLLHYACWRNKKAMAEYLVDKYPNLLYGETKEGLSVLSCAALGGNINILMIMYKLMEDLLHVDQSTNQNRTNETRYLRQKTINQETLLHLSCLGGALEMTKYLVQTYPTMLQEVNNSKQTAAYTAAHSGNVAVLRYLIDSGIDPWCRSSEEETLLHPASINGQFEMTKYLIQTYPTMLKEVDKRKRTAAHNAAHSGDVAVLSYLIESGIDPWCRTSEEETLLHRACINGQLEMTKYLVQTYPTLLQEVDKSKTTAAHNAAISGDVTVLSYLIDSGIDPWCRTSEEETLLHRACINGQLEMTKYLVQTYPTLLQEVDNSKTTAAHNAAESGNVVVLSYLIDSGIDPWCRTSDKETLLHRACIKGHLEMTNYLVQTYPTMLQEVDNSKRTAAHYAAHSGNVDVLSYLIDSGIDPWCRTSEEETLLHLACIKGQIEMTKHLVQSYPTMPQEVDNSKRTAAHYAAHSDNVDLLSFLFDSGIDPWCRTSEEETLLHIACIKGQLEMTKYLVQSYPTLLQEVDNSKTTAAHKAAYSGNVVVLSYLIDSGIDPWCKTSEEETLLHRACINGQLEMTKYLVQAYPTMLQEVDNSRRTAAHKTTEIGNVAVLSYLIESGIDPWCRTSKEETLLHRACLNGQLEMTKYMVQSYPTMLQEVDNSKRTVAHNAAYGGNVAVLRYLFDSGTDPWCRTSEEETLLHRACIAGQLEMTKYLVQTYPTMLQEVDKSKRTAAHKTAHCDSVDVLSFLIDNGIDPWCRTSEKETLLHRACIHGQLEMTKYLVQTYPTMLKEVDNSKRTAAHNAAINGNVAVLSYLIDNGTDPWCRTSDEETLLHRASINGHLEMTKYLVQAYPTMLKEVDNSKTTAAHNAAESGNVAVLSYLIDSGSDPWCRTSEEETLLHRACINGQLEMTKYLVQTYPTMLQEVANSKITAAHNAAVEGNVAVLSYLMDSGLDPWCRTWEEFTFLHLACIKGHLEMTKYLVQSYPTMLQEVDNSKRTAAHHAALSGNVAVLSILIDSGVDPWCKTSAKDTLLHLACIKGQLEMTKYLVQSYPTMLQEVDNSNRTAAHKAASSGNVAVLSYLIANGIDTWCRNIEEETLLHRACIAGQLEMTKYLVQTYPTMLQEVDKRKRTAAHHAAQSSNVAVLSYLIDSGIDPWCRTFEEETLLHRSCIAGQIKIIKYLVQTYPKMLQDVDTSKRTAAHYAVERGNVALLSYLIDSGIDPWCRTSEEETLLHLACIAGHLEMTKYLVQYYPTMLQEVDNSTTTAAHKAAYSGNVAVLSYLIDSGIDPWCRTSKEETLLHRACIAGQLEMTKYLVQTYPTMLQEVDNIKSTAAHYAAHSGNVAVLSYLIGSGIDPWCRTSEEETLLHLACIVGQLEMTKNLVRTYPTMLQQVDNSKRTAAHNAAYGGNVAVLRCLIDSGIDPWCRSSEEETLLHRACTNGQLEMTKYLAQTYPAMLQKVDNSKRTAAHSAAQSGNSAVLSYLIESGIDPWCRTSKEETLLHQACIACQLQMAKYLVHTYSTMLQEVDNRKRTSAHNATQSGNVALLRYLIDSGIDPWCRSSEEETLLHQACIAGQLEMTKYLVQTYPKMLQEVDNSKILAVHNSVERGNVAVLTYLIDSGIDPWCKTSEEKTLLHRACINGQLEMTKYLVQTYPTMVKEVDSSKRTAAHHAAYSGNVDVLSFLIDSGIDPWCRTSKEETLLHLACIKGQLEMTKHLVQSYPTMLQEVDKSTRTAAHHAAQSSNSSILSYLIHSGIDPWCRTSEEETLLHRACIAGQLEITKYLVQTYPTMVEEVDSSKRTAAHHAAVKGNVAVLSYVIDSGIDPWCRTSEEETLLHRSCINGQLEMTKYLIQSYPTMLKEVDKRKRTAAHNAAHSGNVAVLSYLIESGIDPWCRTSEEETLLHRACINGQLEMTKYLVQTYPTLLQEVDNSKTTAAHNAAESGNVAVLSYLIDSGIDPWCRTSEEETLLHRACINGQLEMTKYLVQSYPTMLQEVANSKRTAVHNAAESGNVAVLSFLIDNGIDPCCRTSEEETLLHRACIAGQLEMTKYLVQAYPSMLLEVDRSKRTPAYYAGLLGFFLDSNQGDVLDVSVVWSEPPRKKKCCNVM